jgi:hypothetical protein
VPSTARTAIAAVARLSTRNECIDKNLPYSG